MRTGNVRQLDAYRAPQVIAPAELTDRQMAVREHLLAAADRPASEAPTALVGLSIKPNGIIQSCTLQVEPEHVVPVLAAMRILMGQLESYLTSTLMNKHLMVVAVVASIVTADIMLVPAVAGLVMK